MSRNGDQSRSRSGLRNNKLVKAGALQNTKRFNQQQNDPIQDASNKSRSLGRKTNDKTQMMMNQNQPYGHVSNMRDSSVSNNSNPNSSSLAAYSSVGQRPNTKFGQGSTPSTSGQFGMMNNFMPSNLSQAFYPQANQSSSQAYAYEINLNAVNKSMNNNSISSGYNQSANGGMSSHHPRSSSNDYDNPKASVGIYISNKNGKGSNGNAISTGGNNVIVEMDAENNEDESYYLSQSPIRRGVAHGYNRNLQMNNKSSALSNNPSTFGQGMLLNTG
jgi:hypothetical protein